MGIRGTHIELMQQVPLLWQALVVVVLWSTAFIFSSTLRSGLRGIATSTPGHWLVFVQALRIGALGGIIKGIRGEVTSSFVFWIEHTGLPLWRLSPPRRVAALAQGYRPSIPDSVESRGLRADRPTDVPSFELLDERAGVFLHLRVPYDPCPERRSGHLRFPEPATRLGDLCDGGGE